MVWVRCGSLLPKSVDSRGTRTMAAAAPQTRFIMIDVVRAKLRTIHLRCSSNARRRAARNPAAVNASHIVASSTSLTRTIGPNGLRAPRTRPMMPAGTTPPAT